MELLVIRRNIIYKFHQIWMFLVQVFEFQRNKNEFPIWSRWTCNYLFFSRLTAATPLVTFPLADRHPLSFFFWGVNTMGYIYRIKDLGFPSFYLVYHYIFDFPIVLDLLIDLHLRFLQSKKRQLWISIRVYHQWAWSKLWA